MSYGSKTPPTYADIRLITGDQRAGKSNTLVAFPVGDYHTNLDGIIAPNGQVIKAKSVAKSVNPSDYTLLKRCGLYPNKLKYVRVYSPDGKQSKLIRIPQGYIVQSPVHIFANFHLFGVRFSYISIEDVIEYMNTELFNDSWILSDESAMTDARNSMDKAGKLMAQFGATIGKRNAKFCIAAQYNEMAERRFRLFATTRITCSYDEETKYINLIVKKKGEPEFETDYYAPLYWKFFKTQELIAVPQHKIDRALGKYGDGSLAKEVAKLKKELERTQKELGDAEEANLTLRQALQV
jgi:hypothetical protein